MTLAPLAPGESRVVGAWRFLRQSAPTLVVTLGATALGVWPLFPPEWQGVVAGAGAATTVAGALWALLISPSRNELLARNGVLEAHLAAHEGPTNERISYLLRELLRDLGAGGPDCRASLFARLSTGQWTLIGRFSANAELRKSGRAVYQTGEGLVDQTWQFGDAYISGLPETRRRWERQVAKDFRMDATEVSGLRMQSRSYACVRVDRAEGAAARSLGVLLLESTAADGVKASMIDAMKVHWALALVGTECAAYHDVTSLYATRP